MLVLPKPELGIRPKMKIISEEVHEFIRYYSKSIALQALLFCLITVLIKINATI